MTPFKCVPGESSTGTSWQHVVLVVELSASVSCEEVFQLAVDNSQSVGQLDRRGVDPAFRPEAFSHDADSDTYTCPGGKILRYEAKEKRVGRINYKYRARAADCHTCSHKDKCCPQNAVKGRTIVRGEDDPVVVAFSEKMQTDKAKQIYKERGGVAEFPNAWIKDKIGLRQFRLRGLIKVGMEAMWACMTYNIQQWIRLCWKVQRAAIQV